MGKMTIQDPDTGKKAVVEFDGEPPSDADIQGLIKQTFSGSPTPQAAPRPQPQAIGGGAMTATPGSDYAGMSPNERHLADVVSANAIGYGTNSALGEFNRSVAAQDSLPKPAPRPKPKQQFFTAPDGQKVPYDTAPDGSQVFRSPNRQDPFAIQGTPIADDEAKFGGVRTRSVNGPITRVLFQNGQTGYYNGNHRVGPQAWPGMAEAAASGKINIPQATGQAIREIPQGMPQALDTAGQNIKRGAELAAWALLPGSMGALPKGAKPNRIDKTLRNIPGSVGNLASGIGMLPFQVAQASTAQALSGRSPQANQEAQQFAQGNMNAAGLGPGGPGEKFRAGNYKGGASQLVDSFEEHPVEWAAGVAGGVAGIAHGYVKAGVAVRNEFLARAGAKDALAEHADVDTAQSLHDQADALRAQAAKVNGALPPASRLNTPALKSAVGVRPSPIIARGTAPDALPPRPGVLTQPSAEPIVSPTGKVKAYAGRTPDAQATPNLVGGEYRPPTPPSNGVPDVTANSGRLTDLIDFSHAAINDIHGGVKNLQDAGAHAAELERMAEAGEPLPKENATPKPEPRLATVTDRASLEAAVKKSMGLTDEQAASTAAIADARAQTWAKATGRPVSEWYQSRIAGIGRGAGPVPESSLEQNNTTKNEFGADVLPPSGKGLFHGTSSPVKDLTQTYNSNQHQNLYGPGFYTTDSPSVAKTYMNKGRGSEPSLYHVEWTGKNPANLIDLNRPLPHDALEIIERHTGEKLDPNMLGKDAYKAYKDSLADQDMTTGEAQEAMHDLSSELVGKGYDGFTHTGGVGKEPHNVTIFFEPVTELYSQRVPEPDISKQALGWEPDPTAPSGYSQKPLGFRVESVGGEAQVKLTPANPDLLHQNPNMQGTKGTIEFLADHRAIIEAWNAPDASTGVHELSHIFRRDMYREGGVDAADIKAAEEWAGVKDGVWKVAHEEKFARGFERYLADGKAPTEALRRVFDNFKAWMVSIYQAIKGQGYKGTPLDVDVSPAMREVFDRLLGKEKEGTATAETPIGFETAKGSTYTIDEEGRTTRTKTAHAGHETADVGVKEKSHKTYYVSPEDSQRIGMHGAMSGKKTLRVSPDGKQALLLGWNEAAGKWGMSPSERASGAITLHDAPTVGLHPVELWNGEGGDFSKWHPGNAITSITHAEGVKTQPAEPPTPPKYIADSLNRETMRFSPEVEQNIIAQAKEMGIDKRQTADTAETLTLARALNLSPADLKDWQPGAIPHAPEGIAPKIWRGAWEMAVSDLNKGVQNRYRETQADTLDAHETYQNDPTQANQLAHARAVKAEKAAKAVAMNMLLHDKVMRETAGQGLQILKNAPDPAIGTGYKDSVLRAPSLAEAMGQKKTVVKNGARPPKQNTVSDPALAAAIDAYKNGRQVLKQEGGPKNPQTETPEFRNWFGESKVVDEKGQPQVLYHGTPSPGFNDFRLSHNSHHGLYGTGHYFTDDPSVASSYATNEGTSIHRPSDNPSVYPVHVRVEKPFNIEQPTSLKEAITFIKKGATASNKSLREKDNWRNPAMNAADLKSYVTHVIDSLPKERPITNGDIWDAVRNYWDNGHGDTKSVGNHKAQEMVRAAGHDGITHIGGGRFFKGDANRHNVTIAFDPKQIKSAIGNRGTFDPTDPNILHQDAPDPLETIARYHFDAGRTTLPAFREAVEKSIGEPLKLEDARSLYDATRDKVAADVKAQQVAAVAPLLKDQLAGELGRKGADQFLNDLSDPVRDKLIQGEPLTSFTPAERAEIARVWDLSTPERLKTGSKASASIVKQIAREAKGAGSPTFEELVGRRVQGGKLQAALIKRDLMADAPGKETVETLMNAPEKLTKAQATRLARAIDKVKNVNKPSDPNAVSLRLTRLMKDARTGKLDLVTGKDLVEKHFRDKYTEEVMKATGIKDKGAQSVTDAVDAKLKPIMDDLAGIDPTDYVKQAEVVNKHDTRGFEKFANNFAHYYRGNLLSNTMSLPAIFLSHALSNAWEKGIVDPAVAQLDAVASKAFGLERGISSNYKDMAASSRKIPEAFGDAKAILKGGENAATLRGGHAAVPRMGLRGEFNGSIINIADKVKNPVAKAALVNFGKAINAPTRFWNRQHGAVFNLAGVPMYDNALRDAGRLQAIKDGLKGAAQDAAAAEYYNTPTEAMEKQALANWQEKMFANPNLWAQSINKLNNLGPLGRMMTAVLQPFANIPANLAGRSIEHTPLGILKGLSILAKGIDKISPEERVNAFRSIVRGIGGTAAIAAAYKYQMGLQSINEEQHKYSPTLRMPNGNRVEVGRIAPTANPFGAGALLREKGLAGVYSKDFLESVAGEGPYMGLLTQMEGFFPDKDGAVRFDAGKGAASMARGLVPGSAALNAISAQFDPTGFQRQKQSGADVLANLFPGPPKTYKGQALNRQALPIQKDSVNVPVQESGGLGILRNKRDPSYSPLQEKQTELQELRNAVTAATQQRIKPNDVAAVRRRAILNVKLRLINANLADLKFRKNPGAYQVTPYQMRQLNRPLSPFKEKQQLDNIDLIIKTTKELLAK